MANLTDAYKLDFQAIGIDKIEKVLTTIQDIEDAIKEINKVRVTTDLGSKQYQDLSKSLAEVSNFRKGIIAQQKQLEKALSEPATLATGSYRQLNAELISLKNKYKDLSEVERNSTFGKDTRLQIQILDKELKNIDASIGQFQRNVGNYKSAFSGFIGAASGIGAAFGVGVSLQKIIADTARISDAYVDVSSAANLSKREVDQLNKTFRETPTRTGILEFFKLAEIGGKAGVEKNLDTYARGAEKIKVALGGELGSDAEGTITQLTKIANLFDNELDPKDGEKVANSLLNIGNGIQYLANRGVASGNFLADFTQRLGGLRSLLGDKLTLGQVLGLGAGFEELGVSAEVAATAVNQVAGKIGQDIPKYAKLAGISAKEFADTFNSSPVEALIKLATNVKNSSSTLVELEKSMGEAEFRGARVGSVFAVLGGNADKFRTKINEATEGLTNQNTILEKYNQKQETLGASLDRLQNAFSNGFNNSELEKSLSKLIDLFTTIAPPLIEVIGLLIQGAAAATGISAAIAYAEKETTKYNISQQYFNDTIRRSKIEIEKESIEVKRNIEILKDSAATDYEKQKAKETLIKQYPDYVKGINLEKASIEDLTQLENNLTDAIIKRVAVRQKAAAIETLVAESQQKKLRAFELKSSANPFSELTVSETTRVFGQSPETAVQNTINQLLLDASDLEKQARNVAANYDNALGIISDARTRFENERDDRTLKPKQKGQPIDLETKEEQKASKKAASAAKKEQNELEKFLSELGKIQLNEAEKNGNALQKLQDEQNKTRVQGIEDEQARETQLETNRFNVEIDKLKQLGVERENEILKQAAELQQKLNDSDNLTKSDKERIEKEITKIKLNAGDIRLQIEEQANAQIELETIEHERKLTDIKDKYAKKANEDLLKRQKENFDFIKSQLDTEFKQIDLASAQRQSTFTGTPEAIEANKTSEKIKADQQKLDALRLKLASAKSLNDALSFAGLDADFSTKDLQTFVDESLVLEKQITEGKEDEKKKRLKIDEDETAKRKKNLKDVENAALEGAKLISDGLFKIQQDRLDTEINNELTAVEKKYNAEIEAATNNKQEQERLQKELEEKKREIEIKAIKERAQQNKSQALIDGALSVLKTFATLGFTPAGIIAAALAGVATGVQIAVINSESDKQISALKAEQGAIIENPNYQQGRDIQGRRHSQNGELNYVNGKWIEAEQGERFDRDEYGNAYIFSRSKTSKYRAALDRVSGSTFQGKGSILRGIMKAEQGAFLPKSLPVSADNVSRKDLNISVSFSDSQIDLIAEKLAQRTGASVYGATVAAGQENNRRVERENITLNNAIL